MVTLSSLPPPEPGCADPLLPFELMQLNQLRSALRASSARVRYAFFGLADDPYQWVSQDTMELIR